MEQIATPVRDSHFEDDAQHKARSRPLPLRVRTFGQSTTSRSPGFDITRDESRSLDKCKSSIIDNAQLSPHSPRSLSSMLEDEEDDRFLNSSPRSSVDGLSDISTLAGSPETPLTSLSSHRSSIDAPPPDIIRFDFSRIDYELERAKVLGSGLWSTVYLAEQTPTFPVSPSPSPRSLRLSRSSKRRPRTPSVPLLFAVKTPARKDAKEVFLQEARVLSRLQYRSGSRLYIVPFYGFDERHHSLVFDAVIGGSLEDLSSRMKQMTEVARHLELISLFPGIASDLIGGLEFLHNSGVIHADIKPGNVLLDISEHTSQQTPVVRARYIDFSAAFIPDKGDSASNAGGTWDYMAPEQMRIQKDLNTPTFASDVWSLGITLLYIMIGSSPYTAACGGNTFMLREAIKCGDPIGFARNEPVERKRLAACQDFVDCCRLALKKERENRITAKGWMGWLQDCDWDVVG